MAQLKKYRNDWKSVLWSKFWGNCKLFCLCKQCITEFTVCMTCFKTSSCTSVSSVAVGRWHSHFKQTGWAATVQSCCSEVQCKSGSFYLASVISTVQTSGFSINRFAMISPQWLTGHKTPSYLLTYSINRIASDKEWQGCRSWEKWVHVQNCVWHWGLLRAIIMFTDLWDSLKTDGLEPDVCFSTSTCSADVVTSIKWVLNCTCDIILSLLISV